MCQSPPRGWEKQPPGTHAAAHAATAGDAAERAGQPRERGGLRSRRPGTGGAAREAGPSHAVCPACVPCRHPRRCLRPSGGAPPGVWQLHGRASWLPACAAAGVGRGTDRHAVPGEVDAQRRLWQLRGHLLHRQAHFPGAVAVACGAGHVGWAVRGRRAGTRALPPALPGHFEGASAPHKAGSGTHHTSTGSPCWGHTPPKRPPRLGGAARAWGTRVRGAQTEQAMRVRPPPASRTFCQGGHQGAAPGREVLVNLLNRAHVRHGERLRFTRHQPQSRAWTWAVPQQAPCDWWRGPGLGGGRSRRSGVGLPMPRDVASRLSKRLPPRGPWSRSRLRATTGRRRPPAGRPPRRRLSLPRS